ncbi:BA14K family protein [Mesorhizobium sp. J8]|uniref:BA14K family protein n=1 Tax=Mesorhizobium sp. J8 TaxID=2777475 RepID=UPI0019386115|nr:BA14K family protein [Mesorhizobium sp. J8]BCM18622.1 hypothetical protein MJ8_23940 [Mesorhizobium sp. J8]
MKALLGIAGGFVLTLAVFASGLAFATWLLAAKPVRQATPAIGVSELWTKDAQPVDPQKQNLERIPAQQAAATPAKAGEPGLSESTKADGGTQTTALATPAPPLQPLPGVSGPGQPAPPATGGPQQPAAVDQGAQQQQLPVAHLQWCAARYRSYRPAENSYRSYSGELRPCISPYYEPGGGRTASTEAGQNEQAAANDRPDAIADQMSDDQAEMEGYAPSSGGYATTYGGPPEEISPQTSGRPVSADHVDYCFSRYRSYDPRDNTYQPFDGGPRRQCE